jgi:predicted DNA-binding helix-hairpin-helix protein
MDLEPAEDTGYQKLSARQQEAIAVSHAALPNGKRITMLKTLLTSACEHNCYYCPFRAGRDFRRASLKPDEMARAFMAMHRSGVVQGIFLSSGVAGGSILTQDKIIFTAEILRSKYKFDGYIHLKLMPGAERAQIEHSMRLADRISVNLEAPNSLRLKSLAPRKAFMAELLQPLRWVEEIRQSHPAFRGWKGRWPSTVTQFVVGAVDENDLELLSTTAYLYKQIRLSRTYFSSFRPIADTPFENLSPTPPLRGRRLYQASFLLRDYGFELEDLAFDEQGNLPRGIDPKTAWAQANLAEQPVEINTATRQELLRVPGIGLKGVLAILTARRNGALRSTEDLNKIGVNPKRAVPFILLNGRRPLYQMVMF